MYSSALNRVRRLLLVVGATLVVALPGAAIAGSPSGALDLSAYRGKVVYLDFWASWCTPCRVSFPWMDEIQQQFASRGLVVIGVNVDHNTKLAKAFLADNGADFRIIFDPKGRIARQFNFKDMPTSFLIGRDGKIRSVHSGFYPVHEMDYRTEIEQLLNEGAS